MYNIILYINTKQNEHHDKTLLQFVEQMNR